MLSIVAEIKNIWLVKQPKVVALVPAYNEEQIIKRTIDSLMNQTYPFEYVLVIANNCTDKTVDIVHDLQKIYEDKLRLEVMTENKFKKSGALNFGFSLLDNDIDYIFSMDADTIVDTKIIEEGVKQLEREKNVGGICSAYRTFPIDNNATKWQRFIWRMQNIEFALANAWRIENYKSARVLPGVSVIYRMKALKQVQKLKGDVWATDSLVEDYRLTLDIKDLSWEAKSSLKMISWSDVPLKIRGKGGLTDQRQRWYSGTIDELRLRKFKKHSRYELFTIFLLMFNLLARGFLYSAYTILLIRGVSINWITPFLLLPIVAAVTQLYRLIRYADRLDKWQVLFTLTLFLNEVYAFYREMLYAYSIFLSFRRPNRSW